MSRQFADIRLKKLIRKPLMFSFMIRKEWVPVHDLLPLGSLLDYSPRERQSANLWGGLCVAIYRDSPSVWRSRLPWIVGGIIGAALIIVLGLVLLNARSNQATADNGQASTSAAIDTIAQSL